MTPKWQKLASLAQEIRTLWFQLFGAVFASKGYHFKNIFVDRVAHTDILYGNANMSKINSSWKGSIYMVLFTHSLCDRQHNIDLGNCAILDSACRSTMCGKKWLDGYIDSLDQSDKRKIQQTGSRSILVFGVGNHWRSCGELCLPAEIAEEK